MELNERIEALYGSVELLDRRIAKLTARLAVQPVDRALKASILEHVKVREEASRELRCLKQQYNQRMLSKMVTGGIKDDQTLAWWMNRY